MMKTLSFLITAFFAFAMSAPSQTVLAGRVTDALRKEPIAGANVFIANTSLITITDKDGRFSFNNISIKKGDLIINASGYNHFVRSFSGSEDINAALTQKEKELDAVIVSSYEKDGFKKWGKLYLDLFIGETPQAADCRIENKDALKFRYDKASGLLEVTASDPLVIINKALGYRIDYTVEDFAYNTRSKVLFYSGYPSFTELEGSERKLRRWHEARNECYKGSIMHFMRSLYRNTITAEGFTVQQAYLTANAEKARIKKRMNVTMLKQESIGRDIVISDLYPRDSGEYYSRIMGQEDSLFSFTKNILPADSFAFGIDSTTAGFYFNDYLLINYAGGKGAKNYSFHAPRMYSFVKLLVPEEMEVFQDGNYYNSNHFFTRDYWANFEKISRMLPYGFKYGE